MTTVIGNGDSGGNIELNTLMGQTEGRLKLCISVIQHYTVTAIYSTIPHPGCVWWTVCNIGDNSRRRRRDL